MEAITLALPPWLLCVGMALLLAYGIVGLALVYRASLGIDGYETLLEHRTQRHAARLADRVKRREERAVKAQARQAMKLELARIKQAGKAG